MDYDPQNRTITMQELDAEQPAWASVQECNLELCWVSDTSARVAFYFPDTRDAFELSEDRQTMTDISEKMRTQLGAFIQQIEEQHRARN